MGNIEKIMRMVTHLRTGELGHKHFDFSCFNEGEKGPNGCGTLGCAIGEIPILWPADFDWNNGEIPILGEGDSDLLDGETPFVDRNTGELLSGEEVAMRCFGLNLMDALYLFFPGPVSRKRSGLAQTAGRYEVSNHIERWANAQ